MDSYRCSDLSVGVEGPLVKMHNTLQCIAHWDVNWCNAL